MRRVAKALKTADSLVGINTMGLMEQLLGASLRRKLFMSQTLVSLTVPETPDKVWQVIGGFGSLPDWLPYIAASELSEGGRVRHLANPTGQTIIERLESFDNKERSYTCSLVHAPFPVSEYTSTIRVRETDLGGASRVEWSGQFTAMGTHDGEVARLFQGIYATGLRALAARFAAQNDGKKPVATQDGESSIIAGGRRS